MKSLLHIQKWITERENVILVGIKLHYEPQVVLTLFVHNAQKQNKKTLRSNSHASAASETARAPKAFHLILNTLLYFPLMHIS